MLKNLIENYRLVLLRFWKNWDKFDAEKGGIEI
jgi:hypothetical protein